MLRNIKISYGGFILKGIIMYQVEYKSDINVTYERG
jgi:hypothetical protein